MTLFYAEQVKAAAYGPQNWDPTTNLLHHLPWGADVAALTAAEAAGAGAGGQLRSATSLGLPIGAVACPLLTAAMSSSLG